MVGGYTIPDHGRVTPPRPVLRIGWAVHKALWALSGHRIGTMQPGRRVGTLFLLSTGRTTGLVRRNALYYIEDGPAVVVVASNAGEGVDPAWWRNLQATPEAMVEIGRQTIPVAARLADPDERARLWPRLVVGYPEYAAYQASTPREIPVVVLDPV